MYFKQCGNRISLKFCLNKKVVVNYFLRLLDNKSNDFLGFICYMNHYLCNFSIDLFEVILTIQRLCLFNFGLGKKLLVPVLVDTPGQFRFLKMRQGVCHVTSRNKLMK